ncbi:hypothetical protein, partial [uncultured Alistipes sp.]|uniref:hypothetical protein n=1 Tax=uncultured Alistipes sp. TaxID=538949 RepID=UPI002602C257
FQSWYYAAPGPVIYVRFGDLRIACMVRKGECSVKSRCFGFAIAPLNMTAKTVIPSVGSRTDYASRMECVFSMPAHNGWG